MCSVRIQRIYQKHICRANKDTYVFEGDICRSVPRRRHIDTCWRVLRPPWAILAAARSAEDTVIHVGRVVPPTAGHTCRSVPLQIHMDTCWCVLRPSAAVPAAARPAEHAWIHIRVCCARPTHPFLGDIANFGALDPRLVGK